MTDPKAIHPVRVAGSLVAPGQPVPTSKVSPTRLAQMQAKGRVSGHPTVDRAAPAGRDTVKPTDD
ncbi:MAG: hypothetical protein AAF376_08965 [Pseudomonadota bacterium]